MYGPPSQRLILASPMFWAMMTTMDAEPIRSSPIFGGAFFWIIFYALCAAALLLTTLTSFDRRLGRIDDAASWLCLPSRLVRIFTALYAGWSLCFALFLFLPSRDADFHVVRECVAICSGIATASGQGVVAACGRSLGWSD